MKKKWRLAFGEKNGVQVVQLQFTSYDCKEWLTQSQYEISKGHIPVVIIYEISQLKNLDYEQTYSVDIEPSEIW